MTRAGQGLILVAGLCLLTYLTLELPWRYRVAAEQLLANGDLSEGLAGWEHSGEGVDLVQAADSPMVRLAPPADGQASFLSQLLLLPEWAGFDYLRVALQLKTDDVIAGAEPWQKLVAIIWSFDREAQFIWYWPKSIAVVDGRQDWTPAQLVIPLAGDVSAARLVVFNGAVAGTAELRGLTVQGLTERPAFRFLRLGLFGAWPAMLLWTALCFWRARGNRTLKLLSLSVAAAIVLAISLPQPYYGNLGGWVETELRGLVERPAPPVPTSNAASERPGAPGAEGEGAAPDPPAASDLTRSEVTGAEEDADGAVEPAEAVSFERPSLEELTHGFSFLLLAFLLGLAFPRLSLLRLALFIAVSAVATEVMQMLLITRSSEWRDLFADWIGAASGLGLAWLVSLWLCARRPEGRPAVHPSLGGEMPGEQ